MEAGIYNEIVSLFIKKTEIFKEIITILEEEKNSIINIDTDKLWSFTRDKNARSKEIEVLRKEILERLSDADLKHNMDTDSFSMAKVIKLLPSRYSRELETVRTELLINAEEIKIRSEENRIFINEYLSTLDDMTSIIMGTYNQKPKNNTYSSRCFSNYLQHDGV